MHVEGHITCESDSGDLIDPIGFSYNGQWSRRRFIIDNFFGSRLKALWWLVVVFFWLCEACLWLWIWISLFCYDQSWLVYGSLFWGKFYCLYFISVPFLACSWAYLVDYVLEGISLYEGLVPMLLSCEFVFL